MPWCGQWTTAGAGFWWLVPLAGLVFMVVMFLACSRGFGCLGGRRRRFLGRAGLPGQAPGAAEDARTDGPPAS